MSGVILTRKVWISWWSPRTNAYDLNVMTVGLFMYKWLFALVTDVFDSYFYTNCDLHGRETRNAGSLYVPYDRLNVRRSSIKIHRTGPWNILPSYMHKSESSNVLRIRLRNKLVDKKCRYSVKSSLTAVYWIFWLMIFFLNIKTSSNLTQNTLWNSDISGLVMAKILQANKPPPKPEIATLNLPHHMGCSVSLM